MGRGEGWGELAGESSRQSTMPPQQLSQEAPIRRVMSSTPTPPHEGEGSRDNINREQSYRRGSGPRRACSGGASSGVVVVGLPTLLMALHEPHDTGACRSGAVGCRPERTRASRPFALTACSRPVPKEQLLNAHNSPGLLTDFVRQRHQSCEWGGATLSARPPRLNCASCWVSPNSPGWLTEAPYLTVMPMSCGTRVRPG